MPEVQFAGTRKSEQANATDAAAGISHAVIQDVSGRLYDIFVSTETQGRHRLRDRARAAWALQQTKGLAALGFAYDQMLNFYPGALHKPSENNSQNEDSQTNSSNFNYEIMQGLGKKLNNEEPTVLICSHLNGCARELNLLTTDDCTNVGTALGAIHRLRPTFLQRAKYPSFTTGNIRAQLTGWIKRLRAAGHIPSEITDSWSRVLETEGLWSFDTCPVHGGFCDGDFLFSGSTISAITNWQSMQINDPARDLAWIFAKLNEQKRNALLSAYGRVRGSHLDSLIMLRANLWLQMEQVGDFIQALQHADNAGIMRFKAQVERLAHELMRINSSKTSKTSNASRSKLDSTITVGDLVNDDTYSSERKTQVASKSSATQSIGDNTEESDITLEGHTQVKDPTNENVVQIDDSTNESCASKTSATKSQNEQHLANQSQSSNQANTTSNNYDDIATQVITNIKNSESSSSSNIESNSENSSDSDNGVTSKISKNQNNNEENSEKHNYKEKEKLTETKSEVTDDAPETIAIPLLEREERAMRDAKADLDE